MGAAQAVAAQPRQLGCSRACMPSRIAGGTSTIASLHRCVHPVCQLAWRRRYAPTNLTCRIPCPACAACRVLYGQMHVTSYDWLDPQAGEETALPRGARRVLDATRTADDPPVVLFPRAGGNIHEFTAHTDCAVLDLMSPPYSTGAGRCYP